MDLVSTAKKLFLTQEEHPVMPIVGESQILYCLEQGGDAAAQVQEYLIRRAEAIQQEAEDPYRHGHVPEEWGEAEALLGEVDELLISGGNRASKTEFAAKYVNKVLNSGRNKNVLCLSQHAKSSLQIQQPRVWKYFPKELKVSKKTKSTFISYSSKNGFSDQSFILPNGGTCFFYNYTQDIKIMEGLEYDLVWADELIPLPWVETLRYRLVTRQGKMILTFTPKDGVNNTYRDYVGGARVTRWREARYFEKDPLPTMEIAPRSGVMPYEAQCQRESARVMFWFSEWNPWTNYERMKTTVQGAPKSQIMIRLYGWASEMSGRAFPRFNPDVHVVSRDRVPAEGTNYWTADPAPSRNWFQLWGRATPSGDLYIYRESPNWFTHGDWAEPSEKSDGKPGPAQKLGAGQGVDEIKRELSALENGELIFDRRVDPRAGASQQITHEGGQTVLDLLREPGHGVPGLDVDAAPSLPVAQGVSQINDLLAYDVNKPIGPGNRPRLYVSEDCKNLIFAMQEWTGMDGEKGATKDPIDALRYMVVIDPVYVSRKSFQPVGGGAY